MKLQERGEGVNREKVDLLLHTRFLHSRRGLLGGLLFCFGGGNSSLGNHVLYTM